MTQFLAAIRGWRTLVIQAVTLFVALGVASGVIPAAEVAGVTEASVGESFDTIATNVDIIIASIMGILAIVNTVVRFFTKTPVFK